MNLSNAFVRHPRLQRFPHFRSRPNNPCDARSPYSIHSTLSHSPFPSSPDRLTHDLSPPPLIGIPCDVAFDNPTFTHAHKQCSNSPTLLSNENDPQGILPRDVAAAFPSVTSRQLRCSAFCVVFSTSPSFSCVCTCPWFCFTTHDRE